MRITRTFGFSLLLLLQFSSIPKLGAQQQTIKVDVKVVNILATVRDQDGRIVAKLSKDDFVIEEDGRPQTLKYFVSQTDAPLVLGLLIDTSASQSDLLADEQMASVNFFHQVLRQDRDLAFVVQFGTDVRTLQTFTSSTDALKQSLGRIERPEGSHVPRNHRCGFPGTLLYDALSQTANDSMKSKQGRKAVILLTDGLDAGSCTSLKDAIEHLQRADTIVYSIFFFDSKAPVASNTAHQARMEALREEGRRRLLRISQQTGGTLFELGPAFTLEQAFQSINEELRTQYNLGYSSDQGVGSRYRKITVRTKIPQFSVQSREGYYGE